jgi:hypothetical protein
LSVSARWDDKVVSWRLWGQNAERSKVPSWMCVTGIESGASSAVRTDVKDVNADTMLLSGR